MPRANARASRAGAICAAARRLRHTVRRSRSEDGQALAEFALVLPIILVVVFGIALFGFALNDWINETQLTSEAARFAAVDSEHGTGEAIKEPKAGAKPFLKWVTEQGDNGDVKEATATLCSPKSQVGEYVEVKLTYAYKWLGLFKLFGRGGEVSTPITSTAQMRIETPPSEPYPTTC